MKSKRISNTLGILVMSLSFFFITSCNKDDNEPITLHNVENNSVDLKYPNTDKRSINVIGGDGNYSASCDNASILEVEVSDKEKTILLKPLAIGNAIVTITDKSNNSYILNVNVSYYEDKLVVVKQDVVVIGDKISPAQKKEIEQKAMLTFPVKVNGGYKLVHNNEKDSNKGQALIYKDKYDWQGIESIFEIKNIEVEYSTKRYRIYTITIEGKQREFILNQYITPPTKGDMMIRMALIEVLTEEFCNQQI